MIINKTKYALPATDYFDEIQNKDLIELHFTAGSTAVGAFATFRNDPDKVATAFLVDIDSAAYELFHPGKWAYHLGMKKDNPGFIHDKRSIGIEIVNPGPLTRAGEWLKTWYGAGWCKIAETSKYVQVPTWRGYNYYATFTDGQYQTVIELTRELSSDFGIPRVIPPPEKRMQFDVPFFSKWKGIAGHQNFRLDKCDPGPAWDWDRFSKGLNS